MISPTIRDVAKRAGVGVGTVSRVLNGSPQVRAETRARVLAAIEELGFSPNISARQLSGGKTFAIGILSPFFTFPSFVERMAGIQDVLETSPYDIVLYSVRTPDQVHYQLRTILNQKRVDGLIVLSLRIDEDEFRRLNPDFPVVMVIEDGELSHYPYVVIDNFEGGKLAANYLIERGHQRIGFIGDPIDNPFGFTSTLQRFEGFKLALTEAGLPLHDAWFCFGEYSQESARETARALLSLKPRPTALFVAVDTLALGALAASYDLGLNVPQDIAIIGFDDIQAAHYINLTTVRQHLVTSGRWCAQQLLAWLDDAPPQPDALRHQMPLEIVDRSTV